MLLRVSVLPKQLLFSTELALTSRHALQPAGTLAIVLLRLAAVQHAPSYLLLSGKVIMPTPCRLLLTYSPL